MHPPMLTRYHLRALALAQSSHVLSRKAACSRIQISQSRGSNRRTRRNWHSRTFLFTGEEKDGRSIGPSLAYRLLPKLVTDHAQLIRRHGLLLDLCRPGLSSEMQYRNVCGFLIVALIITLHSRKTSDLKGQCTSMKAHLNSSCQVLRLEDVQSLQELLTEPAFVCSCFRAASRSGKPD